ncbi:DUF1015 domain-containing protein, partial [bacterium]|nr:DUF1015 domain-containing protein [bacterium]
MATISPFRGYYYNSEKVGRLNDVITPPYDVIPAGGDQKLWDRSPYNFAHVDLPKKKDDDYASALQTLSQWVEHKVLRSDPTPGYYWYRQTFNYEGGRHVRSALVCAVLLHDFSEGIIRPHENTHGAHKKDRLQSIRKTGFNLSHIFGMVKDADGFFNSLTEGWDFQHPLLQGTTDDGTDHAVWRIEPDSVPQLEEFFAEQPIYIVDGHHRYESALAYAREVGAYGKAGNPAASTVFTICSTFDPGLLVLPTHRGIHTLEPHRARLPKIREAFDLTPATPAELSAFVAKPTNVPAFFLGFENQLFRAIPKGWETSAAKEGRAMAKLPMHWSDRKLLGEVFEIPVSDFSHRIHYDKDAKSLWEQRSKFDLMIF